MNDVLKVFRSTNPGRNLPGMKLSKDESRKEFLEKTYNQVPCNSGDSIPLKFALELKDTCCRNWRILRERSRRTTSESSKDVKIGKFL